MTNGEIINRIIAIVQDSAIKLIIALIIFLVGIAVIKICSIILLKSMKKKSVSKENQSVLLKVLKWSLTFVLFIIIMQAVSLPLNAIIIISFFVIIILAVLLKNHICNFAYGMVILFSKPFIEGDYLAVYDEENLVKKIGIFNCVLVDKINQEIIVENKNIFQNNLYKIDNKKYRKVTVKINVISGIETYRENRTKLVNILFSDENVTKKDQISIYLVENNENSYTIKIIYYLKSKDYIANQKKIKQKILETIYL